MLPYSTTVRADSAALETVHQGRQSSLLSEAISSSKACNDEDVIIAPAANVWGVLLQQPVMWAIELSREIDVKQQVGCQHQGAS